MKSEEMMKERCDEKTLGESLRKNRITKFACGL